MDFKVFVRIAFFAAIKGIESSAFKFVSKFAMDDSIDVAGKLSASLDDHTDAFMLMWSLSVL